MAKWERVLWLGEFDVSTTICDVGVVKYSKWLMIEPKIIIFESIYDYTFFILAINGLWSKELPRHIARGSRFLHNPSRGANQEWKYMVRIKDGKLG